MHRLFSRLILFGLLIALGGCGLKGPLYMPSAHAEAGSQHRKHTRASAPRAPAASSSAPALPADDDSAGTGGPRP